MAKRRKVEVRDVGAGSGVAAGGVAAPGAGVQAAGLGGRDEMPDASAFGRLVAAMARLGMTAAAARAVIGNGPNGRTRAQIAAELIAWARGLPKG